MTISIGDKLAKVEHDASQDWFTIKGEVARVFEVTEIRHVSQTEKIVGLKEVE